MYQTKKGRGCGSCPKKEKKPKKSKKDIEIENLKAELESKNDLLLRTAAEFDNFKKRTERERLTVAEFAKANIIKELLPILDNIDRASVLEDKESPEDCLLREVREETGLTLTRYAYRGIVTFVSDRWETEYMHLYTADGFTGTLQDCDEGTLEWVDNDVVPTLPTWEGDRVFLRLIQEDAPFFSLKLCYEGDTLTQAVLNGVPLAL